MTNQPSRSLKPRRAAGASARLRLRADNPLDLIAAAVLAGLLSAGAVIVIGTSDVGTTAVVALVGVVVIPLVYPAPTAERVALAVALVGAWALTIALVSGLPEIVDPAPSVGQAVGGAVFHGVEYQGRGIALAVSFLVLLAAVVGGLMVRRGHTPEGDQEAAMAAPAPPPRGYWLVALTVLIALPLIPSMDEYFQTQRALLPDWDVANLELWDYLVTQGFVPMKDFFYPYGGQWVFALIPEGPLLRWISELAMLGLAAWSLWRLTSGNLVRVGGCLLALALIATWNPFVWRFLPGFLIPLSYAAIGPAQGRLTRGHLVFGAACLFGVLYEADLLVYGLAGCGLVLLGELVAGLVPLSLRRLAVGVLVDAVPVAVAVAATVGVWAATDTLDGNLDFFGHLGATTVSGAVQLTPDLQVIPTVDAVYVALPAVLAVAGFALARSRERATSALLLAAAGFTLVFTLKHLVRPVDKLPLIPIVAGSWAVILLWRPRSFAPTVAAAITAVALVVLLQDGRAFKTYATAALEAPVRVFELGKTAFDSSQVEDSAADRFMEPTYGSFQEAGVAAEFRHVAAREDGTVPGFAVLGDAQLLYLYFDQPPPFHNQLYDAAPLFQQERLLEALRREPPRVLVWRHHYEIDDLPYEVRDPLVFEWAIRNYVPLEPKPPSEDSFVEVLRRRRPGEPIAADFWQASLGTMDLGYIPSYSKADELEPCDAEAGCAPVAVFENDAAPAGGGVGVHVSDAEGDRFGFVFRVREGVDQYPVRLDRLWFWPMIDGDPQLIAAAPGWSVEVVDVDGSDDLY